MMRRIILILLLAAAGQAVAGCGAEAQDEGVRLGSPDIIGVITEVTPAESGTAVGTIGFEVKKVDPQVSPDRYVITIDADTLIYRQVGDEIGDLGEVEFGTLQAGQGAEVWLTGPVAESFPMQATAKFIVVSGSSEPGS